MKRNILSSVLLTAFSLIVLSVLVSATVTVAPALLSSATLPSDDNQVVTFNLNFNVTNNDASVDQAISLSTSGLTDWSPVLSKASDLILAGQTNNYVLSLTAPKYKAAGVYPGIIKIINSSSGIDQTLPVSLTIDAHPSLIFSQVPSALTKTINSSVFKLKNDGNEAVNNIRLSVSKVIDSDDQELELFLSSDTITNLNDFSLAPQAEATFRVNYTEDPDDIDLILGTEFADITASSAKANASTRVEFKNDFCDFGQVGTDVEITGIKDNRLASNTAWNWEPLDEVEIKVTVKNKGNSDEDFGVTLILYDPDKDDRLIELEEVISIDEDNSEDVFFTFTVPADVPDNARIYVKAYLDGSEDEQCDSTRGSNDYESIDIKRKSRFIAVSNIEFSSPVLCGENVQLTAKVFNVGKSTEDKVKVRLLNSELGIDFEETVTSLDKGEGKTLSFNFKVPVDADEKTYNLDFTARYNYKKSTDSYLDTSDTFTDKLVVDGGCALQPSTGDVLVSANLDSQAVAGEDLIVRVSINNLGSTAQTFVVIPFSYEEWSSFDRVEPSSITLLPKETRDVKIFMKPNADVSGEQSFNIRVIYGDKVVDQPVSVFITGGASSEEESVFISSFKSNWFIWVIVLANIVLIIIIVVAAVRIASRK